VRTNAEIGVIIAPLCVVTVALPDLFGRATTVWGEHAALRATLSRLRRFSVVTGDERPEDDAELRDLLARFSEQLLEHFAAEEHEEYFGTLIADCPRLADPIARLRTEHREMMGAIVLLKSLVSSGDRLEFASRLGNLLDQFLAHERAENLLLQEFFLRDEGGG
jgi:hypothetical protein